MVCLADERLGGSVVMKSDYSYDCGLLLSFLSPLPDWQQLTELSPLICPTAFHFHLCYIKPSLFWTFISHIPSCPCNWGLGGGVGVISTSFALQNRMPIIFHRVQKSHHKWVNVQCIFSWIIAFIQIGCSLDINPGPKPPKKRLMMLTLSYSAAVSKMATTPSQAGRVAYSLS